MGNAYTGPASIVPHRTVKSGTPIMYITNPEDGKPELVQGYSFKNGDHLRVVAFEKDDAGRWNTTIRATNKEEMVAVLSAKPIDLNFKEALEHFEGTRDSDPRFVTDTRVLRRAGKDLAATRGPDSPAPDVPPSSWFFQ